MAAAKKKFIIEEKATFKKRLIWSNKTKRPLNLTGYTALMQIKAIADEGSAVLLELSQANGRITITPISGNNRFIYLSRRCCGDTLDRSGV